MALVILAMLILLSYQTKFKEMCRISLRGIILVMKCHNPLKGMDAWETARILRNGK